MTEYEIIDAIVTLRSEVALHSMNFVSVMFGYIVAAYFVGAKLSKFQVSVITLLYVIWSPLPMMGGYDAAITLRDLYTRKQTLSDIELGAFFSLIDYPALAVIVGGFSWLMSIVFMFQVRASIQGGG